MNKHEVIMKFIFNLIFFGIIWYIIWQVLPQDKWDILISWVESVYDLLKQGVTWAIDKLQALSSGAGAGTGTGTGGT